MMGKIMLIGLLACMCMSMRYCGEPEALLGIKSNRQLAVRSYEIKDHLKNVRVVVGDTKSGTGKGMEAEVQQARHIYPYGSTVPGSPAGIANYPYTFNGQEADDEVSGAGDFVHFQFREYSAQALRFTSLDPLADKSPGESPYRFAGNDPVNHIDDRGLEEKHFQPEGMVFEIRAEKMHGKKLQKTIDEYSSGFFRQYVPVIITKKNHMEEIGTSLSIAHNMSSIMRRPIEGFVFHSHQSGTIYGVLDTRNVMEFIGTEIASLRNSGAKFVDEAYLVFSACFCAEDEFISSLQGMASKSDMYVVAAIGMVNHTHKKEYKWQGRKRKGERILFSDMGFLVISPDGTISRLRGTLERSGNYIHYDDIRKIVEEVHKIRQMTDQRIDDGDGRSIEDLDDPDFQPDPATQSESREE